MKLHWISSVLVFVLVWWVQELHAMDEQGMWTFVIH